MEEEECGNGEDEEMCWASRQWTGRKGRRMERENCEIIVKNERRMEKCGNSGRGEQMCQ